MFKKTHLHVHYPFLVFIKFRLVHRSSGQLLMNFSKKVKILRWSYPLLGVVGKNSEINWGRLRGGGFGFSLRAPL